MLCLKNMRFVLTSTHRAGRQERRQTAPIHSMLRLCRLNRRHASIHLRSLHGNERDLLGHLPTPHGLLAFLQHHHRSRRRHVIAHARHAPRGTQRPARGRDRRGGSLGARVGAQSRRGALRPLLGGLAARGVRDDRCVS